ncbi:MAG: hypothetical protein Q4E91_12640 [Lachnospiraceae bacterium]|nr:hypothetical protein [Lachnospiraceae bacterium]
MIILDGIKNFLMLVNDHWTEIIVVAGLALAVWKKVAAYLEKTDEEKIQIAKEQLRETILKFVTQAEEDYDDWVKAGAVKRAQVIDVIFQKYPILNRVTDQEALIAEIDNLIDEALDVLREILSKN